MPARRENIAGNRRSNQPRKLTQHSQPNQRNHPNGLTTEEYLRRQPSEDYGDEEEYGEEVETYTPQSDYEEEIIYDEDITDDYRNTQERQKRQEKEFTRDITDDADEIIDRNNGIATESELDDEDRELLGLPSNNRQRIHKVPQRSPQQARQPQRPLQPQDMRRIPQSPQQILPQQWQKQPQYNGQNEYYNEQPPPPRQPRYEQQYEPQPSQPGSGGILGKIRNRRRKKAAEQAFEESLYRVPQGQPSGAIPPSGISPIGFTPGEDDGGGRAANLKSAGSQILMVLCISLVVFVAMSQFIWPYPGKSQYQDDITRLETDLVAMRSVDEKYDDKFNTINAKFNTISDQTSTLNSLGTRVESIEDNYAKTNTLDNYITEDELDDTLSDIDLGDFSRSEIRDLIEEETKELITTTDDLTDLTNDLEDNIDSLSSKVAALQATVNSNPGGTGGTSGNVTQVLITLQNDLAIIQNSLTATQNSLSNTQANITTLSDLTSGNITVLANNITTITNQIGTMSMAIANIEDIVTQDWQGVQYSLTGSSSEYLFSIESGIGGKYVARIMLVYPVAQDLSGNTTDEATMDFFDSLISPNRNYVPRIVYNGVTWQLAEIECYTSSFTLAANVPAQYHLTLAGLQNFSSFEPYIEVLKSGTSSNVGNGGSI